MKGREGRSVREGREECKGGKRRSEGEGMRGEMGRSEGREREE